MSFRSLMLAAGMWLGMASFAQAGGDPFYFSTWYAQSNVGPMSLSSGATSVMPEHSYQAADSSSGSLFASSQKYFQPGYGYATPRGPFRSALRFNDQHYSFGRLTQGSPYNVGVSCVPTLHAPWSLVGSPGNDREFLSAW